MLFWNLEQDLKRFKFHLIRSFFLYSFYQVNFTFMFCLCSKLIFEQTSDIRPFLSSLVLVWLLSSLFVFQLSLSDQTKLFLVFTRNDSSSGDNPQTQKKALVLYWSSIEKVFSISFISPTWISYNICVVVGGMIYDWSGTEGHSLWSPPLSPPLSSLIILQFWSQGIIWGPAVTN